MAHVCSVDLMKVRVQDQDRRAALSNTRVCSLKSGKLAFFSKQAVTRVIIVQPMIALHFFGGLIM